MFLLVGPSGVGKNTLIARLMDRVPGLSFIPSLTTRAPRPGERQGQPYLFVDPARFDEAIRRHDLLEWQEVHGNRYGTSRGLIEEALAAGRPAITDIDVLGSVRAKAALGDRAVTIFLRPPSLSVLEERIRGRDPTIPPEELARRLARAEMEMELGDGCDFQVVNGDLDAALGEIAAVVGGELSRPLAPEDGSRRLRVEALWPDGPRHLEVWRGRAESPDQAAERGLRCLWWEGNRHATRFAVPEHCFRWRPEAARPVAEAAWCAPVVAQGERQPPGPKA